VTRAEYKRTTAAQLAGRQGIVNRELANGWTSIKRGTPVVIRGKKRRIKGGSGLVVETVRCECCGVKVFMTAVAPEYVDLLDDDSSSSASTR